MSDAIRIAQTQPCFSRSLPQRQHTYLSTYSSSSSSSFQLLRHAGRLRLGFISKPKAVTRNEDDALLDLPVSVQLQPIVSHGHFDQTITQSPEPVIILWMATWCRKCIYLKPKLEKLAAEYFPRIRFYSIDVNAVPHKLVAHAEIAKMPTIQVWRDGKKQGEVIGGHKAHLVIDEVREMIENDCCP